MNMEAALNIARRFITLPLDKRKIYLGKMYEENISPANLPLLSVQGLFNSIPLSYAQQRQWFLWQLEPESTAYNMPTALRFKGDLNIGALRASFEALIARHESLRTTFRQDGEQALQIIHSRIDFALTQESLEGTSEELIQSKVEEEVARPFDLEHDTLLRVKLLRLAEDDHVLILTLHHIVSDGWSMPIMVDELVQLYEGYCTGQQVTLPELPIQYADYAIWQRQWMEAGEQERQLAYWKAQLGEEQPVLELPTDRPRPAIQRQEGANFSVSLNNDLAQLLKQLAQQQGVTLFMLLLASFQTLLHRYSGQDDIRVGVPTANRNRVETERLIGFFVNTQVLKARFDLDTTFSSLLKQVQQAALGAQAHQDLPFEQLVEALHPERSLSHSPLFQVMYNHQTQVRGESRRLSGLTVEGLSWEKQTAQFDLTLDTFEYSEGIGASLSYATALFDKSTIERLAGHWINLLQGIVKAPSQRIAELPLLSPEEQQQIIYDWNRTEANYPSDRCIHQLIEAQVEKTPDAVAVVFGDEELTYQELNRKSNQLAHKLRESGVGPDVLVGIAVERSLEMVIGLLAILKAGGAYVPLDPEYPQERLAYIVEDSGIQLLLTQGHLQEQLPISDHIQTLVLNQASELSEGYSEVNPESIAKPENLAYMIYTSGSTGQPKGVIISHGGLSMHIAAIVAYYRLGERENILQFASLSFDAASEQIWESLSHGVALHVGDFPRMSYAELSENIRKFGITLLDLPPAYLLGYTQFLKSESRQDESVRVCVVGGESWSQRLLENLHVFPNARVFNAYGPTETVITPLSWRVNINIGTCQAIVPIGCPIGERSSYLLSDGLNCQPISVNGEICIAGKGLARGYHQRPALTAEKFLPNPFDTREQGGSRLYRTGDLARYRADGVIEYVGRIDHQVKIRGFRIELGEIEARLQAHESVREAVVVDIEGPSGKQLVGYLVAGTWLSDGLEQQAALRSSLRDYLKEVLPDYMVPAHLLFLDKLPLTANGKLDRKALPKPDASQLQQEFVAPQSELEQQIASIWADVLKIEKVGLTDNFFELGGDSIISIQVVSRARQAGIRFTPKELFQHQTVQGLASVAKFGEEGGLQIDQEPVTGEALLLPIHQQFFGEDIPERHHWNQALLLKPGKALDAGQIEQSLQALIVHHDALRLSFIQGTDHAWTACYRSVNEQQSILWTVDVEGEQALEKLCNEAQRSLNLQEGPLIRAVLATLANGSQRLLLAIHHLVVDGVSWRILLEDLQTAYSQLQANQTIKLPAKTSSTKDWAVHLQSYANSEALQQELGYWTTQLADTQFELPCDNPEGSLQGLHAASAQTRLDQDYTRQLLQEAPAAYRTQVNDLLLTALARVIARWTQNDDVLVQLEGHGREDLFEDIDLTRTVGWFTSVFPMKLSTTETLDGSIKGIKEQLRAIPHKGIGFGALRYLGDESARQALSDLAEPRITFNYLGQFDGSFAQGQDDGEGVFLAPTIESPGASQSELAPLGNWLSINGQVYSGELSLNWSFSREMFKAENIQHLAREYAEELKALIEHCIAEDNDGLTPSDVPLAGLSQEQLDVLPIAAKAIEDIYPLSPMQQGMLFHTLYAQDGGDYINQMRVDVQGLDIERFRQSWQTVLDRHDVLRANFITQFEQPLQVIRKQGEIPFVSLDWRTQHDLQAGLDTWAEADRQKGFDLLNDPLLRIAVIRTGENSHHLIYTGHHILMDGWSNSQLLGEVLQAYAGVQSNSQTGRYRDYIEWLQKQDKASSEAFWKEQLNELEEPTRLVQVIRQDKADLAIGHGDHYQVLDQQQTRHLSEFARQQRVTVNTLVQAAWLLLLQRYTGQDTVSFGATVAGRPVGLKGVEQQLGLFINTLPVIARPNPEQSVAQWIEQIQEQNLILREHEHTPLYDVQRWAGLGGEVLFDTILVFENYPISEALQQGAPSGLKFGSVASQEQTNYPLTLAVGLGDTLSVHYSYDRECFSTATVQTIAQHFGNLLQILIESPQQSIGELPLLSQEEQQQIIYDWNRTEASYPSDQCIHQLIEARTEKTPDAVAVVFGDEELTYQDLNRKANQLAYKLRESGVGPDVLVGIAVERSLEMVIGLLAILKAGGAYVPLDPEYPQERLAYMMEDSGIQLLLTQSHLQEQLPISSHIQTLVLDQASELSEVYSEVNLENIVQPENLAYVIYTSGSTGKPKGTLLPHQNVMRLFQATQDWYQFGSSDVWSVFHSYAFDFSVWELYGALLYGAKAVIVPKEVARSPEDFHSLLVRDKVTILSQTPSAFKQLIPVAVEKSQKLSLRYIIFGGEALDVTSLAPWFEEFGDRQPQLVNMYGITETTVHVTYRPIRRADVAKDTVSPIGEVIPDLSWYLLDGNLGVATPGCHSELHIGRAGLARGYHHRPALTAERFTPDPFDSSEQGGGRLYRTGDLAKYRSDGVIEYVGRIDHQVKIRGFRIELGEIEAQLQSHEAVREAVVIDIEGLSGKQLVGYLVADTRFSDEVEQQVTLHTSLRDYLKEVLPDYMIPAYLLFLDKLPLTPNGKLDRKALPKPDASQLQQEYVAPQSELEQRIATIWTDVLKVEKVGLTDNFFELGGDSIISIQVVSRARQAGIRFTPKELFQYQTVQGLASVAKFGEDGGLQIDQGPVSGEVLLLPIHQQFFGEDIPERHHWNQALLLKPGKALDAGQIDRSLQALIVHHDALRLSFIQGTDHAWTACYRSVNEQQSILWTVDVEGEQALEKLCNEAQRSLNLQEGPLIRAVLATLANGSQRLLLAIHHLVVDGVSWRILLEDLQTAYSQLQANQTIKLPAKTSSTKDWAVHLQSYANSEALQQELGYWTTQLADTQFELPCDNPEGSLQGLHAASAQTRLDQDYTRQLLQEAPAAYRTQVNDLLLTALARVIARWTQNDDVLVQLEGHGREDLFEDIDLTRTVGWFTSVFPMKLSPTETLDGSIKGIKEQLRAIPHKGIGFGALHYLGEEQAQQALAQLPVPRISFNYLGQFDSSFANARTDNESETAFLAPALEYSGVSQSELAPLDNWLSIKGQIHCGELRLNWSFSREMFKAKTIQCLAEEYTEELKALIEHCIAEDNCGLTPSDFPLAGLSQGQLDALPVPVREVENIYPLTPMQQGILFHSLQDDFYVNQTSVPVTGLDIERFIAAWKEAIKAHSILRTSFHIGNLLSEPLQIVHCMAEIKFQLLDWRFRDYEESLDLVDQQAKKDRQHGFSLSRAPLMSLTFIQFSDQHQHLIWTIHHILIDGWSTSKLIGEVLARYAGQAVEPIAYEYHDYLAWLQRQDAGGCERFWAEKLDTLAGPTLLADSLSKPDVTFGDHTALYLNWDIEGTVSLLNFAKRLKVTPNTVIQAVWLLLLQRYTGQSTVCFGATVSGRPVDLPDMDKVLGLFINTLPVIQEILPEQRVGQWLQQLQGYNLDVRNYEHTSLADIQRWGGYSGQPLFDSILVFENYPVDERLRQDTVEDTSFGPVKNRGVTNYAMDLEIHLGATLSIEFMYMRDRFTPQDVSRIVESFEHLLQALLGNADGYLGNLLVLPGLEELETNSSWSSSSVVEIIASQAQRSPHATAVRCDWESLTYKDLEQRAGMLASNLQARGIGLESRVGVALNRSLESIITFYAILKAGAAYVPLDVDYPAERVEWIIRDSEMSLLITHSSLGARFRDTHAIDILAIDQLGECAIPSAWSLAEPSPDNLAYLIYTSGSTGQPKGVAVSHGPLSMHCQAIVEKYGMDQETRELLFMSFAFDGAQERWLSILLSGGEMVLRDQQLWTPEQTLQVLRDKAITIACFPPAYLRELAECAASSDKAPPKVDTYCFGGDAVAEATFELVKSELRPRYLTNGYGPTETVVTPLLWKVDAQQRCGGPIAPIGAVVGARELYVLDTQLNRLPDGVAGELFIGGQGLARGYQARPGLSAERFVADPFSVGGRLYRTGDLVRRRAGGVYEYLGRLDQQVKIRGFRIELGEVEARLREQADVRDAVAIVCGGEADRQLVGYVTAHGLPLGRNEALRDHLRGCLPDYMVPAQIMVLESLPVSPNGKLDRKALPEPDFGGREELYVAPRNALEEQLSRIWAEVLGVERIGVTDNFFERGGDSLRSLKVISKVRALKIEGFELKLRDLMARPSIAELSGFSDSTAQLNPLLLLNRQVASSTPLFCIHAGFGTVFDYEPVARRLDGVCSVYGLQCRMLLDLGWRDESLAAMAIDYAQYIRQAQPYGPYRLMGWSLGGILAVLVAAELEQQGQEVEFLSVVDSFIPPETGVAEESHGDERDWRHDLQGFIHSLYGRVVEELPPSLWDKACEPTLKPLADVFTGLNLASASPPSGEARAFDAEDLAQAFIVGMRLKALSAKAISIPTLKTVVNVWWAESEAHARHKGFENALGTEAVSLCVDSDHYSILKDSDFLAAQERILSCAMGVEQVI